ncbi:MAG: molybdopterin-dependent oxidoreductase [Candidatus Rokubacteria bacterium]|nr:molybdopterin-dependent oxidoreductase [Candidatus Rokubacteria bacterium]
MRRHSKRCGRELNPLIVQGTVHGSTIHGIGAARF